MIKWCQNKRKYFGDLETYLYKLKLQFWLSFSDKEFNKVNLGEFTKEQLEEMRRKDFMWNILNNKIKVNQKSLPVFGTSLFLNQTDQRSTNIQEEMAMEAPKISFGVNSNPFGQPKPESNV